MQVNRHVVQKRIISTPQPPLPPVPVVDHQTIERKRLREETIKAKKIVGSSKTKPATPTRHTRSSKAPVGRLLNIDPNELLKLNLSKSNYPISNNIGIGILSYNRGKCLSRLIESIIKNTDLRRTTVFVSDDASDDTATRTYLDQLSENFNIVLIRNDVRLGVAGNSNRLLKCLSRFAYGIILNDDIEVLNQGWEYFYPEVMQRTGMHHFIYRQAGVYGADLGEEVNKNGQKLYKVVDKPHGAVLAFTNEMFEKVGYFDEGYGLYGMEHVDWSQKAWEFGLQESGFFDVSDSSFFFTLHTDASSVPDRSKLLQASKQKFSHRIPEKIEAKFTSELSTITYIIPFRNFERTDSIKTVVNNIRAQKFPVIEIIMVEQDDKIAIEVDKHRPVSHILVSSSQSPLFNKSKAFNVGVSKTTSDCVILHDADMMALGHYTSEIFKILKNFESCHVGSTVLYTNQEAMESINSRGVVDEKSKCERVVGYYEGGSIACTVRAFWRVGGFNEDFWGYGVEDCDFYARLSGGSNWKEDRIFDFLHLWHSRVSGWNAHHEVNKKIEKDLQQYSIDRRIELQHIQLRKLGYDRQISDSIQ